MRRSSVFSSLDSLQSLELKISLSSLAGAGLHPTPAVSVTAVYDDEPVCDEEPAPSSPNPPAYPNPGAGPAGPA
jgi:hypothetical protein